MSGIRRIFGNPETASRFSPRRGGNPSFRVKIDWKPHENKRGELVPQRHGLPLRFVPELAESIVEAVERHYEAFGNGKPWISAAPRKPKLVGYDPEHEIIELEVAGSLFFDTLASLLDAIEQKQALDQRTAYALAHLMWQWRFELRGFEIWLTWRRCDHAVAFDEKLFKRLGRLTQKEAEQRAHVSVEESRYWRTSLFVKVAHDSAFAELSRDLDARGLVCFVLEGERITDFDSFEKEAFRAGIFDEDDWGLRPLDLIVPHKSAIIWRHANRLLEADPVALVEAVHSILPEGESPAPKQVEIFLLGEGPLLTGPLLTVPAS